jgi:hypothetical protein
MKIASELAFEFVAQGIWDAQDMVDFVEYQFSQGYNTGYDTGEYAATVAIG